MSADQGNGAGPPSGFDVDPEADAGLAEAGRRLFAGGVDFMLSVAALGQLPSGDRPEFCFAGRSNVGKSSLINALTGRKALARASNTPGRTQQLNFFDLGGRMHMVDLPGYGFAEAPPKVVEAWQRLLKDYLAGRATLRRVFLLIDSRRGVRANDHEIMDLLDGAAVGFQTVLTKIDKLKGDAAAKAASRAAAEISKHPTAYPQVLTTSSETGAGLERLRAAVAGLLED